MNFESKIIKNITGPLWLLKDGRLSELSYRREFRQLQNEKRQILLQRQLLRIRKLFQHAQENCPYYQKAISDAGIRPANMDAREISRLPIVTKKDIRNHLDVMLARNILAKDMFPANTGGSTGVPMRFFRDRRCLSLRRAQEIVFDRMMGCDIGDRVALFVSASHTDTTFGTMKERFRNMTDAMLLRFDPKCTTAAEMSNFHSKLMRFSPRFIRCFPNSLSIFTNFVLDEKLPVPEIEAISCTGENIYQWQKDLFESVWGARVFERYGTKECGVISGEDNSNEGQAIFTEGVYVELVDDTGKSVEPGEIGRVILTDLFNYAMPLIRYEIGDLAALLVESDVERDIGFPRFDKILGRDRDIIVATDGTKRPGYLFVEEISDAGLDAKFQIVQKSIGSVEVRVVSESIESKAVANITKRFEALLGRGGKVDFIRVDDIPRDPSGKYRYVVSELVQKH